MSILLITRQALRDSYRGRELLVTSLLFAVVFGVMSAIVTAQIAGNITQDITKGLRLTASVLVPVTVLSIGQPVVAGRREDGRLRLVFGQPVSRVAVVLGTYLAKLCVIVVMLLVGLVVAVGIPVSQGRIVSIGAVATFAAKTLLLAVAYLSIAVGFSASSRSTRWSTLAMFGVFLGFLLVWRFLPYAYFLLSDGPFLRKAYPAWVDLVTGLSPSVAYERLVGFYGPPAPFKATAYISPQFSLGVLGLWTVVPLAVGIWRFVSTDL